MILQAVLHQDLLARDINRVFCNIVEGRKELSRCGWHWLAGVKVWLYLLVINVVDEANKL